MKQYFSRLKWLSYSTITMPFLELDKFADFTFENEISIRVSTGKMAETNRAFPYELNVNYPNGKTERKSYLNKTELIREMAKLDRYDKS